MVNLTRAVALGLMGWILQGPALAEGDLTQLAAKVKPAVAMVIAYDVDRQVSSIGSGFFVDADGLLVTNYHVLKGAYTAEIQMLDEKRYPILAVVAQDRVADLVKVLVEIPASGIATVNIAGELPSIAERVVVVGSPLGLDQTVSEGIVSAIRKMPGVGSFFQISAPISPGSSGSPVVNMRGEVLGVATFQAAVGQNLNFAVSARSVLALVDNRPLQSLTEWTYGESENKSRLAAELCRKGFEFSIQGENKKALEYYREATEKDPSDPAAWYGLGYCYAGLDRTAEAIEAYRQAVRANPGDALVHYNLAGYYDEIGRYGEAAAAYREVVRLNPRFAEAHFRLGRVYLRAGMLEEGRTALEEAVRLEPDNAPALFLLAIVSDRLGRTDEAVVAHHQVLRLQPAHAPSHFNLGLIYGRMGRHADEVAAYKAALRADPDYAPAHLKMGLVYLANGDKVAALSEYKILMKLDREMAGRLFDEIYK